MGYILYVHVFVFRFDMFNLICFIESKCLSVRVNTNARSFLRKLDNLLIVFPWWHLLSAWGLEKKGLLGTLGKVIFSNLYNLNLF